MKTRNGILRMWLAALLLAVGLVWPARAQDSGGVGFRPVGSGSGGGAPNVTTISPGANLPGIAWRNDTAYQFGAGAYPVPASLWVTNNEAGSEPGFMFIRNISNSTFNAVPGRTLIYGTNGPGEVAGLSNCFNIRMEGFTFIGWTNHDVTAFYSAVTNKLFGGVTYANMLNFWFMNNQVMRHADHGLIDAASGILTGGGVNNSSNVFILDNYCNDVGGWRVSPGGASTADGSAIVATESFIEGNHIEFCLRGIEPYNYPPGSNQRFKTIIRNNRLKNTLDQGIVTFQTTNIWNSVIEGNYLENDMIVNYHGTNYTSPAGVCKAGAINLTGGLGWDIFNNTIVGQWQYGISLFNSLTKVDDFSIYGNHIYDLNNNNSQGWAIYIGEPVNSAAAATSARRGSIYQNKIVRARDVAVAIWAGRDLSVYENQIYNPNFSTLGTYGGGMVFGVVGNSAAGLTNVNAWNNTIYSDTANAPAIPYYIADNVWQSRFTDNYVVTNGAATAASASAGWTNRSGNNVTILGPVRTYNASVNLSTIGANAAVDTVISAPGVTTNDAVTVQLPAQFWTVTSGEVSVMAWATNSSSSDGQIVMRTINADSGAGTGDFPSVNAIFHVRQVRVAGQ